MGDTGGHWEAALSRPLPGDSCAQWGVRAPGWSGFIPLLQTEALWAPGATRACSSGHSSSWGVILVGVGGREGPLETNNQAGPSLYVQLWHLTSDCPHGLPTRRRGTLGVAGPSAGSLGPWGRGQCCSSL